MQYKECYVSYKEHQIHYLKFGTGASILVAFHGFADQAQLFTHLEGGLTERYTLISINLPFHGKTSWQQNIFKPLALKEALALIIRKEQIVYFSFMGHSMGGRIILALTPYFLKNIKEIILLAPAGFQNAISDSPYLFPIFVRRILKLLTSQPKIIVAIFDLGKQLGLINKGLHRFICYQIAHKKRRRQLFDCWISLYYFPIQLKHFGKLILEHNIELTFFYGKSDHITPARYGQSFIQRLGVGKVILVAGNHFFIKTPLAKAITKWLNCRKNNKPI